MFAVMTSIAERYAALPSMTPHLVQVWRAYAKHLRVQATQPERDGITVVLADAQPYADAGAMFDDIVMNHRLCISTQYTEHPVWSHEDTIAYRTVHDYFGHYFAHCRQLEAGFDWRGEWNACTVHEEHTPAEFHRVLMMECVGQAAHALHFGVFAPNKISYL